MTPCRPHADRRLPQCNTCERLNDELPHDAEQRTRILMIDASVLVRGSVCPMYAEREAEIWLREAA